MRPYCLAEIEILELAEKSTFPFPLAEITSSALLASSQDSGESSPSQSPFIDDMLASCNLARDSRSHNEYCDDQHIGCNFVFRATLEYMFTSRKILTNYISLHTNSGSRNSQKPIRIPSGSIIISKTCSLPCAYDVSAFDAYPHDTLGEQ